MPAKSTPAPSAFAAIPNRRRWVFRSLMVFGLPLLALLLMELCLRLIGFGYPVTFFIRSQVAGKTILTENPWFGMRFFPPGLARSPNAVVMRPGKPPNGYRIFLFGESAAMGDPRPAYGVGRYLEAMLRRRFPGTEFEVVCVAMTAINSHAVLPIARECAQYQGDLWIVYMGNNEFAGPFGASTVFGPQAPPNSLVRAYLVLQRTRIGQAMVALARRFRPADPTPASWGGLKMFLGRQLPPADPRKVRVYENFRGNLRDIVRAGIKTGVPIILSSVACNLKDCPPFSSVQPAGIEPASVGHWENFCEEGATLVSQQRFAEALTNFFKARDIVPQHAELEFRIGECWLAMTNSDTAAKSFARARDWDALPFRADSRLNRVIAEAADFYKNRGVAYVDAEKVLAPPGGGRPPGNETFYEHVHLNFEGNYRLARAFADGVAARLPRNLASAQNAEWAKPEECAADLGLTDWNRYAALEEIGRRLSDAPYTNQLNQAQRFRQLRLQLSEFKARLQSTPSADARRVYEQALQKQPQDHWLHHNYAEFLSATGDLAEATVQLEAVRDLLPDHYAAYLQLGRLLILQKKYDEALRSLETACRLRPDVPDIYLERGQVYARQGHLNEALQQYAAAQQQQPENAGIRVLRAQLLERQHQRAEAIQVLREAVRLQSSYCEAHDLLGIELGLDGKFAEAEAEFAQVVRLRPENADGHLNLGISLARQERYTEALEQFQTALRLDPQNAKAREFVATFEQLKSRNSIP